MFESTGNIRNEDENATLVEKYKLISSGKIKVINKLYLKVRGGSILLLVIFYFLATPHSIQDPSSPTRERTRAPCVGRAES